MSEWKDSQIKDLGRIITGYTPPTGKKELWEGEIPFYSPADFHDDVYCNVTERNVTELALSNDRIIEENSLMVTCIASIGKIALAKRRGISNQQINTIIFNDNFDSKYCYYLIKYHINDLIKLAGTTAVPIVNKTEFEKIRLRHYTDKSTQSQIAYILSTADAVIEKTQAAITKYKAIKQGMLHDLFTRGIDIKTGKLRPKYEDAPELYKEGKLGWVPKEWAVERIDKLCHITTGSKDTQNKEENGEYPFFVRSQTIEKISTYTYDGEAILTSGDGVGVGKIYHYINGKFDFHQRVYMLYEFEKNISSKYLFYYFSDNFLAEVDKYSAKTTVDSVRMEMIAGMLIPLPEHNEQVKIAQKLISIENTLSSEQAYHLKIQQLKTGLMSDLLSGIKQLNNIAEQKQANA